MSKVLRLANYAQTNTYNLLTGDLYAKIDEWDTEYGDPGRIVEKMLLVSRGKLDSEIAAAEQTITEMKNDCLLFWTDPMNGKSIWWEENADGETAKRAIIYSIDFLPVQRSKHTRLLGTGTAFFNLIVTHDEIFEDVAETTVVNNQAMDCLSGKYTISAIKGSAPARISQVMVKGVNGDGNHSHFFMGIKPTGSGVADYLTWWEAEDFSLGTGASLATDIHGSPDASDNVVDIAFTTNTLDVFRIRGQLSTFGITSYTHNAGEFVVLMRYKFPTGSSGEILVEARSGYPSHKKVHEPVILDPDKASFAGLMAIAEITIPPTGYRSEAQGNAYISNFEFEIYAKQLSGDYALRIDGFAIVPKKHYIFTDGAEIEYGNAYVDFKTLEDGTIVAWQKADDAGAAAEEPLISGNSNWELPIEGGCLVLASGTAEIDSQLYVTLKAHLRHYQYREA